MPDRDTVAPLSPLEDRPGYRSLVSSLLESTFILRAPFILLSASLYFGKLFFSPLLLSFSSASCSLWGGGDSSGSSMGGRLMSSLGGRCLAGKLARLIGASVRVCKVNYY